MESKLKITDNKPCFSARCCAELKRLVWLAIVAGLLLIVGRYYCFDRLNEEIRAQVEAKLRNHYGGLNVSVKSARRVAGQGLEIRGVRIAEGGGRLAPVLAEIEEIFAHCDTRLPEFVTQGPQVTALRVQRLRLRAERKAGGLWNIAHLLPLPPCEGSMAPPATITDATLEIIDPVQSAGGSASGLMLRNIELSIEPEKSVAVEGTKLRLRGTLAGDHFERVEVEGTLDPLTSQWELNGAVEGLEFSPRLRGALPHELAAAMAPVGSIRGRTYFGFRVSRGPSAPGKAVPVSPIEFAVHGKISEGRIDDARLPEALTEVEAAIKVDNRGLSIHDLSARCGTTQIELNASLIGFGGTAPIDIELAARALPLERVPRAALSPTMRETWRRFQPRGMTDVTGRLSFDGRQWQPDLKFECRDLSLAYEEFSYRLTDGVGSITLKPDWLFANLRLSAGGQTIDCHADVRGFGAEPTGWVQLQSNGPIAIDEKLLKAMDSATQRVVRAFHPRGQATFLARFYRNPGDGLTHRHVEINLQQCTIQHERFPYPMDRVSGLLVQDDGSWRFSGLKGRNDSADVRGEGSWNAKDQSGAQQLVLSFLAQDVPLADELREALPPAAQRLWANLRPRGNLDSIAVKLQYAAAARQWQIDVDAQKRAVPASQDSRTIALEPAWFRYALNDVTGKFHYRDGRIDLSDLRANHGRAALSADGSCVLLPGGGCRLELKSVAADHLEADEELLAALPGELGRTLARFPLRGPLNLLGKVALHLPPQADVSPQLTWDLHLDVENGLLQISMPVEHLHGGFSVSGRRTAEGMFARGELKFDSAIVQGVQLTSIQGPYWFDGRQLVFGAVADRDAAQGVPRQLSARMLGGLLSIDGVAQLTQAPTFDVQATLANADVADIARLLAPHQPPPAGRMFGLVHVAGNSSGRHTWRGGGKISLREADLYELPAMVQLLKLLSIQRPDRTAFTNSNIDFRVEGEDIAFERIDFSGDAISLKGKGRMNGQREIDLKFYPLVGREEHVLPIFRPLLGQTSQEFMLIEVTGSLDQLNISRQVFPRLDDGLSQLFPELVPGERSIPNESASASAGNSVNRLWPFPRR